MTEQFEAETPDAVRQVVEGTCPACGGGDIRRYPVLSDGGWFMATKCQRCLHSLNREPWQRMGYVVRLEDVL